MLVTIKDIGIADVSSIGVEADNTIKLVTLNNEVWHIAISLSIGGMDNHLLVFQDHAKQVDVQHLHSFRNKTYAKYIDSSLRTFLGGLKTTDTEKTEEFVDIVLGLPTQVVNTLIDDIFINRDIVGEVKPSYSLTDIVMQLEEDYAQYGLLLTIVRVGGKSDT